MAETVRIHRGPGALAEIGDAYDRLCAAVDAPCTARRPWLQTWVDSYTGWRPWIVGLWDGGELVAAAPLAARHRRGVAEVTNLGREVSDHVRLPARDLAAGRALAEALAERLTGLPGPWRLVLEQLPADEPVIARLAELLPHLAIRVADPSPVLRFDDRTEVEAYLSTSAARTLRRKRRALERDHRVDIGFRRGPEAVELLPQLERVRRLRDAAATRRTMLDEPGYRAFWAALIERRCEDGSGELATLHLDGELVAYSFAILDGPVYRWWEHRFDPAVGPRSPGLVLNMATVQHALDDPGIRAFDWMRGATHFKLQAANELTTAIDAVAWSSRPTRLVTQAGPWCKAESHRLRAASPAIERAATTLKRQLVRRGW